MVYATQRGRRERFLYDGELLSITELLRKPGVVEYLERNGPLAYESQQNKLRRELKVGKFTKERVDEFLRQQQHQRQREVCKKTKTRTGTNVRVWRREPHAYGNFRPESEHPTDVRGAWSEPITPRQREPPTYTNSTKTTGTTNVNVKIHHRHQRRKTDGETSSGTLPTAPRISPTGKKAFGKSVAR